VLVTPEVAKALHSTLEVFGNTVGSAIAYMMSNPEARTIATYASMGLAGGALAGWFIAAGDQSRKARLQAATSRPLGAPGSFAYGAPIGGHTGDGSCPLRVPAAPPPNANRPASRFILGFPWDPVKHAFTLWEEMPTGERRVVGYACVPHESVPAARRALEEWALAPNGPGACTGTSVCDCGPKPSANAAPPPNAGTAPPPPRPH